MEARTYNSIPITDPVRSHELCRRRASLYAKSIAARMLLAADAAYELEMSRDQWESAGRSGSIRRMKGAKYRLELSKLAHLKECAQLAHEMQRALTDVFGATMPGPDATGTGLGQRELDVLLEVLGAVQ